MKINLISGCTLYEATKNTIKEIDFKNMDEQNLVVVPDAFSMQAESLIFDVLDIKSTFNISVVGISRLASKILRDNNIFYDRISGLEEILYTYKAVKNNEENFIKAEIPQEIIEIAENRKIAKQNKDWASADNFRDKILELGYIVKDKPNNEYELIKK